MEVKYIDTQAMGADLSVVNAARVSFNKQHNEFVKGKDDRLIKYLADHQHWTPFAHYYFSITEVVVKDSTIKRLLADKSFSAGLNVSQDIISGNLYSMWNFYLQDGNEVVKEYIANNAPVTYSALPIDIIYGISHTPGEISTNVAYPKHTYVTLHMKAPIFLARQCFKHKIGLVENEVSRRYVDSKPEFYCPDYWRAKAENKKQGSSEEAVEEYPTSPSYYSLVKASEDWYTINDIICPEQRRMALPQSMYTEWWWSGNLESFARFYKLRSKPDAQKEIRDLAELVHDEINKIYPELWKGALKDDN